MHLAFSRIRDLGGKFHEIANKLLIVAVFGSLNVSSRGVAQVIPDRTLPVNSQVTVQGNTLLIEKGTARSNNLFHSFESFSLPANNTAYFNNVGGVRNIFTRITGGNISNIDGILKANGSANLFFLNPNGILFGNNARLNIGGSFVGTTANKIKFADGTEFSAGKSSNTPLLTVEAPVALEFTNPGAISVLGDGQGIRRTSDLIDTTAALRVLTDGTLALIGGDISLSGASLKTAGGRIVLGSVADSSSVSLAPDSKGWVFGYDDVPNFGDIQLSQLAAVDASGDGGGYIQVRGRWVTLTGGSQLEVSNLGAGKPGVLSVNASDLILDGVSDSPAPSGLSAIVYPGSKGDSADITIEIERLIVKDGASITSGTVGTGSSGAITIFARDSLEVIGASTVPNYPNLSSVSSTSYFEGNKPNGNLNITTGRLIIRDGGVVSTATFGDRQGGTLSIKADSVEVSGISSRSAVLSGRPSRLSSRSLGDGNAGNLFVNAGKFSVQDGGQITVRSDGAGDSGTLSINAPQIFLNSGGSITAATVSGNGGEINISSSDLRLNNASITATAGGIGNGGNIDINTDAFVLDNSSITANALKGNGGNIDINTAIFLQRDSQVTASSELGLDGTVAIDQIISPNSVFGITPATQIVDKKVVTTSCSLSSPKFYIRESDRVPAMPDSLEFTSSPDSNIEANTMITKPDGTIALVYISPKVFGHPDPCSN